MSKELFSRLLSLGMVLDPYNSDYFDVITDKEVSDCLLMAYFSMMSNDKNESDKFFTRFEEKYMLLNDEQREKAKVELAKILDIDYKPNIKKKEKGEMNNGKNYRY